MQDLTDRFAAAALTGYLAMHAGPDVSTPMPHLAASKAYEFAAALMLERSRRDEFGVIEEREPEEDEEEGAIN